MINNEPIQLEHHFPCMGVSGYNGDFSNEGDAIPFNKMRKATGEEVMQWRTIRRDEGSATRRQLTTTGRRKPPTFLYIMQI